MTDEALSNLLSQWHHWEDRYSHNRGYPSKAAGMENWRCSRQWDDANGAFDTDAEHGDMTIVEFEVAQMTQERQYAIRTNAKALHLGLSVFRHPRLPENQVRTLEIIAEARAELNCRLGKRGMT